MRLPFGINAFLKESKMSLSGIGDLEINRKIKEIRYVLSTKYNVWLEELHDEFKGYFFENGLQHKYNPDSCQFQTYLNKCAYLFLLKYLNRISSIRYREISDTEYINNDEHSEECGWYKSGGSWGRQYQTDGHDILKGGWKQTDFNNIEQSYLQKELIDISDTFIIDNFDSIFSEIFHGNIEQKEAAAEIDKPLRSLEREIFFMKDKLLKHLQKIEYSGCDIQEIFN